MRKADEILSLVGNVVTIGMGVGVIFLSSIAERWQSAFGIALVAVGLGAVLALQLRKRRARSLLRARDGDAQEMLQTIERSLNELREVLSSPGPPTDVAGAIRAKNAENAVTYLSYVCDLLTVRALELDRAPLWDDETLAAHLDAVRGLLTVVVSNFATLGMYLGTEAEPLPWTEDLNEAVNEVSANLEYVAKALGRARRREERERGKPVSGACQLLMPSIERLRELARTIRVWQRGGNS